MSTLETVFTDEEKKFWKCDTCENELINCECGKEQKVSEIKKLSTEVFGTPNYPVDVKYDSKVGKVIVKSKSYIELDENYELSQLEDLGFCICLIKFSISDGLIIHVRRND